MPLPLRLAFCGSPDFAVESLVALCGAPALARVLAVVTQPDRPAGRRRQLCAPPVKVAAERAGLAVHQWRKLRDGTAVTALQQLDLDLIVVAAYGRILPPPLLRAARLGCLNVHASLLPAWRGASPINRAIWQGDAETGISLMAMDEGLDTGPVYLQRALPIADEDTAGTMTAKLAALGAEALLEVLPALATGTLAAVPQPVAGVSHAPPLSKDDGQLHFALAATQLARQVRALCPWPGTYCWLGQVRVAVLSAKALPAPPSPARPGTIVAAGPLGLEVACGQGTLCIERVKPAGRQEMSASAWIAGRGAEKGATLTAVPGS